MARQVPHGDCVADKANQVKGRLREQTLGPHAQLRGDIRKDKPLPLGISGNLVPKAGNI